MQETNFTVRILNETLGIGEKIARMVSAEGVSFLREASLSITHDKIWLGCTDDVGGSHALGSLLQHEIRRIRFKKSAITPGQQLIKPALSGAFTGVVMTVIMWLIVGERRVSGLAESIGLSILLVLGIAGFFVVVHLFRISWSHLAVVVFEAADGKSVEVAIENDKTDALIALFAQRNIPVEPL